MKETTKPLVLSAPAPRTLDLIFSTEARRTLHADYEVMAVESDDIDHLNADALSHVEYIIGQPPLARATVDAMTSLRAVLNVESNLIDNMPYDELFRRGIHVLTTGAVFAQPVAELGLALALNLARGVPAADADFKNGTEAWGADSNDDARLLYGADVGLVGFGELGRALNRVLAGFRPCVRAYDPWLPPSILRETGVEPVSLDTVLSDSDFVFVVASITTENENLLNAESFAKMRAGSSFFLFSRADIVDFDALVEAVHEGRIRAASDVFPDEPLPNNHPVRSEPNFLCSAHRAGALDEAFKQMGDMVLEDMALMHRALPPMRCKRAERETVAKMRSRPVARN